MPAWIWLPVLGNAAFVGLTTPALPLILVGRDESKPAIAMFFVLNAASGAVLNLTVGAWMRRRGYPRLWVCACPAVAALATAVLAAAEARWLMFLAGAVMMGMSLVFPVLVGLADSLPHRSRASSVAMLRTLFVLGYLAGLGGFSLVSVAVPRSSAAPVCAAAGLAAATALAAARRPVDTDAALRHRGTAHDRSAPRPVPVPLLVVAVGAVLLLRAADSLRLVYLPLYALTTGAPQPLIAGLFAVTATVEVVVLTPLSRVADRVGSRRALVGIAVTGVLSFLIVAVGGGTAALIGSQVVYAVFAAGFQSIGMVLLGDCLRSGSGGGAALFTVVVQVGSTVGALAPLLIAGFSAGMFWIGAGFCTLAAVLLLLRLPAGRRTAAPPTTAAHSHTADR